MNFTKRIVVAAGALAALLGTLAIAAPLYSYDKEYYSDAAMTEYVGYSSFTCAGRLVVSPGTVITPYYQITNKAPCRTAGYPTGPNQDPAEYP